MARLKDKVAIVTGAGSEGEGFGNGKAIAIAFAREGAKVVAADLRAEAAASTRDFILADGGTCEVFVGDLSRADDAAAMAEACVSAFGGIDILHNNIGIFMGGGVVDLAEADWDRVLATNLKTMFLACKFAIPRMIERGGGAIVNIGSAAGARCFTGPRIGYATSKGALVAFTRSIAADYGRSGIRANLLIPGVIETPAWRSELMQSYGLAPTEENLGQLRVSRGAAIPLGRIGNAWDLAGAAVFLASDEASYITGAELVIDGGLLCRAP